MRFDASSVEKQNAWAPYNRHLIIHELLVRRLRAFREKGRQSSTIKLPRHPLCAAIGVVEHPPSAAHTTQHFCQAHCSLRALRPSHPHTLAPQPIANPTP
jgi:hypothetical protein